jgi:hypothetical protein
MCERSSRRCAEAGAELDAVVAALIHGVLTAYSPGLGSTSSSRGPTGELLVDAFHSSGARATTS